MVLQVAGLIWQSPSSDGAETAKEFDYSLGSLDGYILVHYG